MFQEVKPPWRWLWFQERQVSCVNLPGVRTCHPCLSCNKDQILLAHCGECLWKLANMWDNSKYFPLGCCMTSHITIATTLTMYWILSAIMCNPSNRFQPDIHLWGELGRIKSFYDDKGADISSFQAWKGIPTTTAQPQGMDSSSAQEWHNNSAEISSFTRLWPQAYLCAHIALLLHMIETCRLAQTNFSRFGKPQSQGSTGRLQGWWRGKADSSLEVIIALALADTDAEKLRLTVVR